ncbi:hypothetical protein EDD39_5962 [Kitasatospora cineracea]|uniref:Apea-like HEPN domain-containing protein n=1 Tax=Kitasatospora cineracea TaxID=88074 RepID=A0A8G1UBN4_9ACTN|nr:hypothetical protein EDD39_5962 [Kitasatospora cineracea]
MTTKPGAAYWEGRLRLTCILLDASVLNPNGYFEEFPKRTVIPGGMVLAALGETESRRISSRLHVQRPPRWRIEMFDIESDDADELSAIVRHRFNLLCCAQRSAPSVLALLDRFTGGAWRRVCPVAEISGSGRGVFLDEERLEAWGEIVAAWPSGLDDRIAISLEFFRESVAERQVSLSKSLLTLAVAFESLIGQDLKAELNFRLSQRAAFLVSNGPASHRVMVRMKDLYGARSSLVHGGRKASPDAVTKLQQFMMRAIPSMARLSEVAGGFKGANQILDKAPFGLDPILRDVVSPKGEAWWARVDVCKIPGWL